MRLLQRCQQLLQSTRAMAEQGGAFSPSGLRHLESAVHGWSVRAVAGGALECGAAPGAPVPLPLGSLAPSCQSLRGVFTQRTQLEFSSGSQPRHQLLPWAAMGLRGLFGAVKPKAPNPQIHTHDKYKQVHPQPTYDWMQGRFVLDRNGVIWHRQANYRHKRHDKSASQLTRLKRWKPLYVAYARKFKKLGFKTRFWAQPDPQEVPGFFNPARYAAPVRRSAVPDKRPDAGDPALRQSYRPPNRPRTR